ncbi:class I SAM-dependent methyltransferase [Paractinoplanes durhamensis]|uniref:class I SAM-dependent methyltransferase n=1 Tax=Paractinoplanes durhamensis TaxID=113563 RepID=UPI003639DE7D
MDYEELYRSRPPWEIGGPQPALERVLDGEVNGPAVLDIGCGSGDLALALAGRGFQVTAVDISATAVEQARAKAKATGSTVRFEVRDAARDPIPGGPFDAIFDSGLLHWLVRYDSGTGEYLARLPDLAAPGARIFVLAAAKPVIPAAGA